MESGWWFPDVLNTDQSISWFFLTQMNWEDKLGFPCWNHALDNIFPDLWAAVAEAVDLFMKWTWWLAVPLDFTEPISQTTFSGGLGLMRSHSIRSVYDCVLGTYSTDFLRNNKEEATTTAKMDYTLISIWFSVM